MVNFCYFRIINPEEFERTSFRTIQLSEYEGEPIYGTIGYHLPSRKWKLQRIMYPKIHPLCRKAINNEISKQAMRDYIIRKYGSEAHRVLKQRGLASLF